MVIAVDFDGTCTTHDFPRVGKDIGAIPVLKRLVEKGHKLILYTMRSDVEARTPITDAPCPAGKDTKYLSQAMNWFVDNEISLYGVQKNPTQGNWTTSPKCYAELYIDDAALGCPLIVDESYSPRPYVDWKKVEQILEESGVL